jgi:hypothetical protein
MPPRKLRIFAVMKTYDQDVEEASISKFMGKERCRGQR